MEWSPEAFAIFYAIRDSGQASVPTELLHPPDLVQALIASADLATWCEGVTLSSHAALAIGAVLQNTHVRINGKKRDVLRWVDMGTPEPPMLTDTKLAKEMAAWQRRPTREPARDGAWNRPIHLMGVTTPWGCGTFTFVKKFRPCEICGGAPLPADTYCIKCDESFWGSKAARRRKRLKSA